MNLSPLRYPGGKSKLYPLIKKLLAQNNLLGGTYVEPFAGGCGLSLRLLFEKDVKEVIINDLDPSIYAFWFSVLNYTDLLIALIRQTPITINEWHKQKEIYKNEQDLIKLGFATFFLNRTNISGIIKGGAIGGVKQSGKYKIDMRFNKEKLIQKIENIRQNKNKIKLFNLDAKDLLKEQYIIKKRKIFINFDPPYVKKGRELYKNSFEAKDHIELRNTIIKSNKKWIVTYDIHQLIREAYSDFRQDFLELTYSAYRSKSARELIIYSHNLII